MKKLLFILFVFISVVASSQVQQHMMHVLAGQSSGISPISCWNLDETLGASTAVDACGVNDGTNNGITEGVTGKVNTAYDFNGTSDYITFGDVFGFSDGSSDSPFSLSAWVNIDNLTQRHAICTKSLLRTTSEYTFFLFDIDGRLSLQLYDAAAGDRIGKNQTTGTMTAGNWYHVAATYDGNGSSDGINLYVDGALVAMTDNNDGTYVAMENTSSPFEIGVYWRTDALKRWMDGTIDIPQVYDFELSSDEVSYLYNDGDGRACNCE